MSITSYHTKPHRTIPYTSISVYTSGRDGHPKFIPRLKLLIRKQKAVVKRYETAFLLLFLSSLTTASSIFTMSVLPRLSRNSTLAGVISQNL
jgi:hypothetical protein